MRLLFLKHLKTPASEASAARARGLAASSKSHAAAASGGSGGFGLGLSPAKKLLWPSRWRSLVGACANRVQGFPAVLLQVLALAMLALPARAGTCPGPVFRLETLAPQVWLLQGAGEDAEPGPANRGHVTNQVLALYGGRLWLVGAGPTPAFARALDCQLRQRFGRGVSRVLVPWARGENALGARGLLPGAQLWAHEAVVAAMRVQCETCLAHLHEALAEAASDLGTDPIVLPSHRLRGREGDWGPWHWHAVPRSDSAVALVLRLRGADAAPLFVATGWLWGSAPPRALGADVQALQAGTARLAELGRAAAPAARWVGEQGGVQNAGAPQRLARYWAALQARVQSALERGEMPGAPLPLPGVDAAWQAHPQHALNWQRAWRQAEDRLLGQEAPLPR